MHRAAAVVVRVQVNGRDGGWELRKLKMGPPDGSPRLQLAMCTAFGPKNGAPPQWLMGPCQYCQDSHFSGPPVVPTPELPTPFDRSNIGLQLKPTTKMSTPVALRHVKTRSQLLSISFLGAKKSPLSDRICRKQGSLPSACRCVCERAPRWTFEGKLGPHSPLGGSHAAHS